MNPPIVLTQQRLELERIATRHDNSITIKASELEVVGQILPAPTIHPLGNILGSIVDRQLIEDHLGQVMTDEVAVETELTVNGDRNGAHRVGIIA